MGTDGEVDDRVYGYDPDIENLVSECFEKCGVRLNTRDESSDKSNDDPSHDPSKDPSHDPCRDPSQGESLSTCVCIRLTIFSKCISKWYQ